MNRALCALLGYPAADLLGSQIETLVHPDDRARHRDARRAWLAGSDPGVQGESRYVRRDGGVLHCQYNLTCVRGGDGDPVELVVQLVDNTRHRATLDSLQQRLGEQAVITALGERLVSGVPPDALIDEAVVTVAQVLDVDLVAYAQLGEDGRHGIVRSAVGWGPDAIGSTVPVAPEFAFGSRDVATLDHVVEGPIARVMAEQGVAGGLAVLVGEPGARRGLLGVTVRERRAFTGAERNFVRAVAHVMTGALERAAHYERLRHEALHDGLTGLPNRALLLDRLAQELAWLGTTGGELSVLLLDIDSFKHVNDALGHAAGDDLLCEIAPRLAEVLDPTDTIARIAGDEFAIVCVDPSGERHVDRVAERVQGAFVRPFVVAGEPHFVSASLGVVVAGRGEERAADDLLSDADAALHRAKQRGRGAYELFDPQTRAAVMSRLKIETDLRRAIEAGDLRLDYQPYFRLGDRSPAGVEALVRWRHRERGLISPAEFVPVAEDSGLVVPLGEWVLRRACGDLAAWRCDHHWASGLRMTVNVSARQVDQHALPATIAATLREHALPAGLLGVEITEGVLLDDARAPQETLAALKQLGVRVLLDDFGTGYSSLSYLSRFPVDVLKVDRSFVRDLGARVDSTPIVKAIVALARGLGLDVIAEGVETEAQADALRALGCEHAQGFLFARPMAADALAELLSS